MEKLSLVDIIKGELQQAMQQSHKYQTLINDAKTHIKKDFYLRKLKKNNKEVMRLLVAFEKLKIKNTNEQRNSE